MADKAHLQALYRAKAEARGLARPPSVAEQRDSVRVKSEAELPQEKAVAVPMQLRPEPRGAERKDEEPQAKKPRTAAPGGALPSGFFDHGEAAAVAKLGGKEPLLEQSPADVAAAMREFNEAIAQDVQQLEARELEEEEAEVEEKHSLLQFEQQECLTRVEQLKQRRTELAALPPPKEPPPSAVIALAGAEDGSESEEDPGLLDWRAKHV